MAKLERSDFMTAADVARWNGLYQENSEDGQVQGSRWAILQGYARRRAFQRLTLCVGLVESYERRSVLDLACGGGQYGVTVADRGGKWFGMDISREMLVNAKRLFKRKGHPGHVVNGDINHLPFARSSFDVILGVGILSYFPNQTVAQILPQLPDLLRPGGHLILQTVRLDVLTWLRSRLPSWIPKPIRLAGPLYPRKAAVVLRQLESASVIPRRVIELRKYGIAPFQTIYLFEKERHHHE